MVTMPWSAVAAAGACFWSPVALTRSPLAAADSSSIECSSPYKDTDNPQRLDFTLRAGCAYCR